MIKNDRELERASVKELADAPDNVATLGSRLRFRNQETGQYDDAISILSPAGAAMPCLEIGATINWPIVAATYLWNCWR